ncbi:MAG: phage tail tape measure protein [Bosea sp. (in: a-proteobacteria)]|uniref:phage tail tape measure protein n=1 Tax=Bosea sp. (in: a-proteobacteria) TaxID=1871050 RepID=UPI002736AAB6|nr:phage tail tape measure protein [Bosea sp. (in: a-proteobacteria)]MDP3257599.1 phage tail tape measure protein [Bosea sp. (in: a-proteobacteria)]MDP3320093.1 phage tail tape measure protein [Bosea sp. (in: a-proteobacteria)]
MLDDEIDLSSRVSDLRALGSLTQSLDKSAASFGRSITNAFAKGIVEGKRFEDVLRSVGRSITETLLKSALKPLQSSLSNLLGTGLKGLTGLFGGVGLGGGGAAPVAPFADGGVIASPAYFPLGRGLGLMGERGAEAILPLSRGADGKLGVRSSAETRRPLNVVVQVSTPDADSFRRSEAQVSAAIARAVARGSRAL